MGTAPIQQPNLPGELTAVFSGTGGCGRITGLTVVLRAASKEIGGQRSEVGGRASGPQSPAPNLRPPISEPTWAGRAHWEGCPGALAIQVEWWPGDRRDHADSRLFVSHCAGPEGLGAILPCSASFDEDGHRTLMYAAVVCSQAFGCPHCADGGTVTVTVEESGEPKGESGKPRAESRACETHLVASSERAIPVETATDGEGILPGEDGDRRPTNPARAPGPAVPSPLSPLPSPLSPLRHPLSALPRRLRAGIITPSLWLGGVERWIDQILRATDGAIDWAGVAVLNEELAQTDAVALLRRRTPVHGFGYASARPLFDRTDVLLAWGALNLPHVLDGYRGKVVLVSHSDYQGYQRHVVRTAARVCTHFVAVSEYAKGPFYGCVPEDRIDVVANGVDVARCRSPLSRLEARAVFGFDAEDFVVGTIGRISPEKRIERQILALDHLPPEFRLLVAGGGFLEDEARLRALAAERPTRARRVTFAPPTREIGPVLAALDAFLLTSESEGFGLAPLEALAAKVPLVATPVGVLQEIEAAGFACWEPLPPDPTPEALAAAVMQLDHQPIWVIENRREVGRRLVHETYSLEAFGARWANYLERIVRA